MEKRYQVSEDTVVDITETLVYQRYLDRKMVDQHFSSEYFLLEHIVLKLAESGSKIYLKNLCHELEMPMKSVSNLVSEMKDNGDIVWTHDGVGADGTYIQITDAGRKSLVTMEERLRDSYRKVIEYFGEKKMYEYINMSAKILDIFRSSSEGE